MVKPYNGKSCNGFDCDHEKECCLAFSPSGLYCTLPKGHKGNHVACGYSHNKAIWKNVPVKKVASVKVADVKKANKR